MENFFVKVKNDDILTKANSFGYVDTYSSYEDYELKKLRDMLKNANMIDFFCVRKNEKPKKVVGVFSGLLEENMLGICNVIKQDLKKKNNTNPALMIKLHTKKTDCLSICSFMLGSYKKALKDEQEYNAQQENIEK